MKTVVRNAIALITNHVSEKTEMETVVRNAIALIKNHISEKTVVRNVIALITNHVSEKTEMETVVRNAIALIKKYVSEKTENGDGNGGQECHSADNKSCNLRNNSKLVFPKVECCPRPYLISSCQTYPRPLATST